MPREKKSKPSYKVHKRFEIRTRKNYGSMAQIQRIEGSDDPMTLPIFKTFSQYRFAQEFVQKEGDTENVYFINDDKWCWDKDRGWHKTQYHQVRARRFAGSTKFVGDAPERSNGVPVFKRLY